jgi:hypothetical protein
MESRSLSQKYKVKYWTCKITSKKSQNPEQSHFYVTACDGKTGGLSVKKGLTTFGLKTKLYIKAQKEALRAW